MTFTPRDYSAVVRDLLTTLTGGTVRETVTVPTTGPITLDLLEQRPFRRVSHLEGVVAVGDTEVPYRFTPADYELIAEDGEGFTGLRFRDTARRPVPGSELVVNYYPVAVRPAPVTDVNVGSVARTLLESVGREVAQLEQELGLIYDSAFVETATASSLDRVTALVGVRRLPAGVPLADVRFSRDARAPGRVTVPAGTVVTDADGHRYASVVDLVLEPGESSREVTCAGAGPGTPPVDAGALDRMEVLIAGIASVRNDRPASRAAGPETDEELRRRARGALHGVARGTVGALEYGVRSLPGVRDVQVVEAPRGVLGEVRIDVVWEQPPTAEDQRELDRRVLELRPAGIRVLVGEARRLPVRVAVALTLAGAGTTGSELTQLQAGVAQRLRDALSAVATGGTVRGAQLVRAVLADERIVDAGVRLTPDGGAAAESLQLDSGEALELVEPIAFDPVTAEQAGGGAIRSDVDASLPVHLVAGVTLADAREAIRLALTSHLANRSPEAALTVDGVAAAIRDDSRFALARDTAVVVVESAGRFAQLTDGAGTYTPAPGETLAVRTLDVRALEGGA